MKIKTRKQREKEYNDIYGKISKDKFSRLKDYLGDEFNEELINDANRRIKEAKENIEYYSIYFTFYEVPIESHRPRTKGKMGMGLYVPNAKDNWDTISKFVKKLKKDIKVISTPMKVSLKAYYPMPKNIKPIEVLLYETEHDLAIGKPDFDNVLKAYCDMLKTTILLDDDLVSRSEFVKYFSLKPRVELTITYTNGLCSEYAYKKITSRKSFNELKESIDIKLLVTPYKKKRRKCNE